MRHALRGTLVVVMLWCAALMSGCDGADLAAQLSGASAYATRVGQLMQARGHEGFPDNPVSYALYARDLAQCIALARSAPVGLSSLGADVARPLPVEPDGKGLREAFGARGGGTVVAE